MTKLNELAQQILAAKYYHVGENCPADVFSRVADVCSIPDAVDYMLGEQPAHTVLIDDDQLKKVFHEHLPLARRVLDRRIRTLMEDASLHAPFRKISIDYNDVESHWKKSSQRYYNAMCAMEFMPATPTLMNAGVGGMLSSCFAIRVQDSMEGIFDVVKEVAIISQKGGGCGLDVSDLRPEGSPVGSRGGVSSGPISFLKVFNEAGNQVKQGGARRAALLAGMRVDHPDILKFIRCKEVEGDLSNFNISVFITDEFMKAVKDDTVIVLQHPKETTMKTIRAREVWQEIINRSWSNGEPGIIFQDKLDKDDVVHGKYGKLLVNPCSELPLNSYSSCNLASINIAQFVTDDNKFDINKFSATVQLGVQFLDNVIDINNYPLQKIEDITLALRPIGLGIMGLHDLMLHMGIEYGTNESLELIDLVYSTMKNTAKNWSAMLAHRGVPQDLKTAGMQQRNGYLLTAPPTGTISIICNQTSSGIEPVFQWEYTRNDSYGTHTMQHFMVKKYGKTLPAYAKTALEISPEAHVRVQAQVQKYLDESVSKTVNLPKTATKEEIDKIFHMAYSLDCKSITVYRSGSRKEEVLVKKEDPKPVIKDEEDAGLVSKAERTTGIIEPKVSPRPAVLFGSTYCIRTNLGKCYITINEDRSGVREVFITLSKAGSTMNAHCSVEGRLISNQLKYGVPISSIINHLKDTKDVPTWWNGIQINSVPDAVAKALEDYVRNFEGFSEFIEIPANEGCMLPQHTPQHTTQHTQEFFEPCPECGSALKRESGCKSCSCGYSACG